MRALVGVALGVGALVGLALATRQDASGELVEPGAPGRWFGWDELDPDGLRDQAQADDLVRLAGQLDELRDEAGAIGVTSGLRDPGHNVAVGGAERSAHLDGRAADIRSLAGLSAVELVDLVVELALPVDQVIYYDQARGGHVHYGIARVGSAPRLEVRHGTAGTDREPLDEGRTAELRARFRGVA